MQNTLAGRFEAFVRQIDEHAAAVVVNGNMCAVQKTRKGDREGRSLIDGLEKVREVANSCQQHKGLKFLGLLVIRVLEKAAPTQHELQDGTCLFQLGVYDSNDR